MTLGRTFADPESNLIGIFVAAAMKSKEGKLNRIPVKGAGKVL